jgi:hypothetical protein
MVPWCDLGCPWFVAPVPHEPEWADAGRLGQEVESHHRVTSGLDEYPQIRTTTQS